MENFVRTIGMDLAVRGGSHSVSGFGTADDAIVADLSGLKNIRVDADNRIGYIQGGATLNAVYAATDEYGLSVPAAPAAGRQLSLSAGSLDAMFKKGKQHGTS